MEKTNKKLYLKIFILQICLGLSSAVNIYLVDFKEILKDNIWINVIQISYTVISAVLMIWIGKNFYTINKNRLAILLSLFILFSYFTLSFKLTLNPVIISLQGYLVYLPVAILSFIILVYTVLHFQNAFYMIIAINLAGYSTGSFLTRFFTFITGYHILTIHQIYLILGILTVGATFLFFRKTLNAPLHQPEEEMIQWKAILKTPSIYLYMVIFILFRFSYHFITDSFTINELVRDSRAGIKYSDAFSEYFIAMSILTFSTILGKILCAIILKHVKLSTALTVSLLINGILVVSTYYLLPYNYTLPVIFFITGINLGFFGLAVPIIAGKYFSFPHFAFTYIILDIFYDLTGILYVLLTIPMMMLERMDLRLLIPGALCIVFAIVGLIIFKKKKQLADDLNHIR